MSQRKFYHCVWTGHVAGNCWKTPESKAYRRPYGSGSPKPLRPDIYFRKNNEELAMVSMPTANVGKPCDGYKWIYDTGAINHICNSKLSFEKFQPRVGWVQVGNGSHLQLHAIGNVRTSPLVDGKTIPIVLRDIIFAPEMRLNLSSESRVKRVGYAIVTYDDENHTL